MTQSQVDILKSSLTKVREDLTILQANSKSIGPADLKGVLTKLSRIESTLVNIQKESDK